MSLDGLVGKYDEEIDFSQLAKDDPAFANHFVNGRLDLQDSEAVKCASPVQITQTVY